VVSTSAVVTVNVSGLLEVRRMALALDRAVRALRSIESFRTNAYEKRRLAMQALRYIGKEMTMPKKGFDGKKAAPFTKGGGRDPEHPNDSKGQPKKK